MSRRGLPARPDVLPRSPWRWFPWVLLGGLLAVAGVNGELVYLAFTSFPGAAGEDGFDLSNGYDRIIAGAEAQARLGWRVHAEADSGRHPVLAPQDADGRPMPGATVEASAERPVGPPDTTPLTLTPAEGGRLVAREALAHGQWMVSVKMTLDGRTASATARLVVP